MIDVPAPPAPPPPPDDPAVLGALVVARNVFEEQRRLVVARASGSAGEDHIARELARQQRALAATLAALTVDQLVAFEARWPVVRAAAMQAWSLPT